MEEHKCHCSEEPGCNCKDHECDDSNCQCNEEMEECQDPNCHCHEEECEDPNCHCHQYYEDDDSDIDVADLAGHADDKVDALIELLIKKGVFTEEEFTKEYDDLFEDVTED